MSVAKEQIRQIIADNNISSVADVYTFLRNGFKDILQELIEAELNAALVMKRTRKGHKHCEQTAKSAIEHLNFKKWILREASSFLRDL